MPYITQERRPLLDKIVDAMLWENIKADGDLNYILFAFAKRSPHFMSYNALKNLRGELAEARDEIGRRLLEPYEDKKIAENGDVK
ncbi:MAG: hypothetical protein MN733_25265 [Nitrososphaera sp.]|nr:hypothetical protein [Nitrososphaera sp.]